MRDRVQRWLQQWRLNRPVSVWGWFNFLVVQWFGFRISRGYNVGTYPNGVVVKVCLILWVWPMTGWFGDYIPRDVRVVVIWRRK
jgi:hypothetical protein